MWQIPCTTIHDHNKAHMKAGEIYPTMMCKGEGGIFLIKKTNTNKEGIILEMAYQRL